MEKISFYFDETKIILDLLYKLESNIVILCQAIDDFKVSIPFEVKELCLFDTVMNKVQNQISMLHIDASQLKNDLTDATYHYGSAKQAVDCDLYEMIINPTTESIREWGFFDDVRNIRAEHRAFIETVAYLANVGNSADIQYIPLKVVKTIIAPEIKSRNQEIGRRPIYSAQPASLVKSVEVETAIDTADKVPVTIYDDDPKLNSSQLLQDQVFKLKDSLAYTLIASAQFISPVYAVKTIDKNMLKENIFVINENDSNSFEDTRSGSNEGVLYGAYSEDKNKISSISSNHALLSVKGLSRLSVEEEHENLLLLTVMKNFVYLEPYVLVEGDHIDFDRFDLYRIKEVMDLTGIFISRNQIPPFDFNLLSDYHPIQGFMPEFHRTPLISYQRLNNWQVYEETEDDMLVPMKITPAYEIRKLFFEDDENSQIWSNFTPKKINHEYPIYTKVKGLIPAITLNITEKYSAQPGLSTIIATSGLVSNSAITQNNETQSEKTLIDTIIWLLKFLYTDPFVLLDEYFEIIWQIILTYFSQPINSEEVKVAVRDIISSHLTDIQITEITAEVLVDIINEILDYITKHIEMAKDLDQNFSVTDSYGFDYYFNQYRKQEETIEYEKDKSSAVSYDSPYIYEELDVLIGSAVLTDISQVVIAAKGFVAPTIIYDILHKITELEKIIHEKLIQNVSFDDADTKKNNEKRTFYIMLNCVRGAYGPKQTMEEIEESVYGSHRVKSTKDISKPENEKSETQLSYNKKVETSTPLDSPDNGINESEDDGSFIIKYLTEPKKHINEETVSVDHQILQNALSMLSGAVAANALFAVSEAGKKSLMSAIEITDKEKFEEMKKLITSSTGYKMCKFFYDTFSFVETMKAICNYTITLCKSSHVQPLIKMILK